MRDGWKTLRGAGARASSACALAVAALVTAAACGLGSEVRPVPARSGSPALAEAVGDVLETPAAIDSARFERLVRRNTAPGVSLPETLLAARIDAWVGLPVGARVARWAHFFAARSDNVYTFGPRPGGYVAESLLVQDYRHDCVSLAYRCTELARAGSPRGALDLALATRFAGGDPERFLGATGAVDYDDAAHLDYSEDMLQTGLWGRDVTREVGVAVPESTGTSRYPPGSFWYVPKDRLRSDRLRDGDLLYFVLDEKHAGARRLRQEHGLLVGHQGIVRRAGARVLLVHAAASDLPGAYQGNRVVEVPLGTYLRRLERFKGVLVGRLED